MRTAAGRPEKDRNQGVDEDAKPGFLGAQRCDREGVDGIRSRVNGDDRADKTVDVPEVRVPGARHHVGTETQPDRKKQNKQPALLGEKRDKDKCHDNRHDRTDDA